MGKNYWWVNHKTTFRAESEGGYIWSPHKNANGSFNQTYQNLTLAKPGDVIFSYAAGIQATGVVATKHTLAPKPAYRATGAKPWADEGWLVQVVWNPLSKPLNPAEHMGVLAELLPGKYSPIRANGHGNQGCYLAAIDSRLAVTLLGLIDAANPGATVDLLQQIETIEGEDAEHVVCGSDLPATEKRQVILARVGQGLFRQRVVAIEKRCRVTGVANHELVIASHIKPWKLSSNAERLDGYNGLLLSPHLDKLFDRGHISFEDDGTVKLASSAVARILRSWGLDPKLKISALHPSQARYMQFHRTNVFGRPVFE